MIPAHDTLQHPEHHPNAQLDRANTHGEHETSATVQPHGDSEGDTHGDMALETATGDASKQFVISGNAEDSAENRLKRDGDLYGEREISNCSSQNMSDGGLNEALDIELGGAEGGLFTSPLPEAESNLLKNVTGNGYTGLSLSESAPINGIIRPHMSVLNHSLTSEHDLDPRQNSFSTYGEAHRDSHTGGNQLPTSQWTLKTEDTTGPRPVDDPSDRFSRQDSQDTENPQNAQDFLQLPSFQYKINSESVNISHKNKPAFPLADPVSALNYSNNPADSDAGQNGSEDDDLHTAIGDAFKNLVEGTGTSMHSSSIAPDSPSTEENSVDNDGLSDTNLEEAIGAAFKSLANGFTDHKNEESSSFSHPEKEPVHHETAETMSLDRETHSSFATKTKKRDTKISLGAIVHSVVLQMEGLESETAFTAPPASSEPDASSISKDIIRDLASERSTQVHTESGIEEHHGVHIGEPNGESVSGNDDQSQDLDAALKAAVASAVQNAFPLGKPQPVSDNASHDQSQIQTVSGIEKDLDLEQLQMNESLQNVFNIVMAASSAKEAISENASATVKALVKAPVLDGKGPVKMTPKPISQPQNKPQILPRGADKPTPTSVKQLSIAQTLALRRSNMNVPSHKRYYSSIKTLEESTVRPDPQIIIRPPPQAHPQLSTILLSLSQQIQAGTHSSNLMLVIRQMANALMHNEKYAPSFSKVAQDVIKDINSSAEERTFYIGHLQKARTYLTSVSEDDTRTKATALIDSITDAMNARKQTGTSVPESSSRGLSITSSCKKNDKDLPQLYETTHLFFSELDLSRLRLVMAGVKPELDSREHQIRVREHNRERKKKWREGNAERNKDNDLRCRVLKRAALKFGESSSDQKLTWIEREYLKRRTSRLNRQKKDLVKAESPAPAVSDDAPAQDPLMVRRITETFHLLAECGCEEDPNAVLMAVCATISVVALSCALMLGVAESSDLVDSISLILSSVYELDLRAGVFKRFQFLIKRSDSQVSASTKQEMKEAVVEESPNLKGHNYSVAATSDALWQSQKRGIDYPNSQQKRVKTNSVHELENESRVIPIPSSSSSLPMNPWTNTGTSLKMPLYRKPATDPELPRMAVEPVPKITSPFISNRFGGTSPIGLTGPIILKKPGSLQRPVFLKTTASNKPHSLGFPTLYSPSFRLKE